MIGCSAASADLLTRILVSFRPWPWNLMPDASIKPDIPPERGAEITALGLTAGEAIGAMLQKAWQEGIKDGLEAAARINDTAAVATRGLPVVTELHCAQIAMAEFLRDQARLVALQVGED